MAAARSPAGLSRERIVEVASAAIEKAGLEQLSFRGVARELGVTAPSLYAYVDSKEDLVAAVAAGHFDRLIRRFEDAGGETPLDRVRALSRAYVVHAVESPALFRLLFRYPPRPTAGVDAFEPATRAFALASAPIEEAFAAGDLDVADAVTTSLVMWSAVHGVTEVLLMSAVGPTLDQPSAELVDHVVDTVLRGLGAPATRA